MHQLIEYSELIACISFLVPLVPGWVFMKKLTPELRFLIIILTCSFAFSVAGYYTGKHYINNLLIYFGKYACQFYLYSLLFRKLLSTKRTGRIILILVALFTGSILFRIPDIFSARNFDSFTPAFLSIAMLIYCVLFFNQQLNRPQITFIYKTPWFWVITGLLLYFAGSFLILWTTNYLMVRDNSFIRGLWDLQDQLTIIKNLLIALGLLFLKNI